MKRNFPYCLLLRTKLRSPIISFLFIVIGPVAYCLLVFSSCRPPLPVYFDIPIGTKVQGFDTAIAGNYLPLEDIIEKGTKEFSERYEIRYDKIIPVKSDTLTFFEANGKEVNYEEVKDILGTKEDTAKVKWSDRECDSIMYTFCAFNELLSAKLGYAVDHRKGQPKPVAGMIKITYGRIFFITVDSLGNNTRDTLLSLSPSVLLTKYAGKYFLNFKTEWGWEIMQLELWENEFLSARPFYFTNYARCAQSALEFTASTKNIYPALKPVLSKEKKIIGFKAVLNPKLLIEKFKQSEEVMLLLKVK